MGLLYEYLSSDENDGNLDFFDLLYPNEVPTSTSNIFGRLADLSLGRYIVL